MKPQETWNLNQRYPDRVWGVYALMAAQRGPDEEDSPTGRALKYMFTERFRFIVFDKPECGGTWRADPFDARDMAILRTQLAAALIQPPALIHFLLHVRMALEATLEHPIWGGNGPELVNLLLEVLR